MMEAARPHLRVIDSHGEVQDVCEHCVAKDQAIARLTRSYEGTLRNLKDEVERLQDDQDARLPIDDDAENVLELWSDLATVGEHPWFGKTPQVGAASRRFKDTRRALRGVKNRSQEWEYPPRTRVELRLATRGAFVRAEVQRWTGKFNRDWLDPCTIFFANFERNYEAAIDPAPGLQERIDLAFQLPKALVDRFAVVEPLADPCDHCGHIRLEHDKPSIANDFTESGLCLVHGCDCAGFDDFDLKVARAIDAQGPRPRFKS